MDNLSDNQINQKIGILLRREIEARLITQFEKYLSSELGGKKSKHIIREVIKGVAIEQGRELSKLNGNSLNAFIERQEPWTRDGSLETDIIKKDNNSYHYNVTTVSYTHLTLPTNREV